jgi:hypothetical protein
VTGDGKTVLKATTGRYYRGIITGEFDEISPSAPAIVVFSGEYDEHGQPHRGGGHPGQCPLRIDPNFQETPTPTSSSPGWNGNSRRTWGLA